jgi:hypothetical protein
MITIISSLYKSQQHLPRFLKRVHAVSEKLTELGIEHEFLMMANDPNPEETKFLDEYASKNYHIKKCVRPLETIYASWNAGIERAQYDIITFWNADDIRFTQGFVSGIKSIKAGAEAVYFPFIYKRYIKLGKLKILAKIKIFFPPEFDLARFQKEMHGGPFFMTTKRAFQKAGVFDATFRIAGDFEWFARASRKGVIMKRSPTIAGIFTNDGTTLSGSKSMNHKAENERVYNAK